MWPASQPNLATPFSMSLSEPREWMQFANLPELSAQFVTGGHRPQVLTLFTRQLRAHA
jgi:hypothetical protein